jgi:hypothetical protein
MSWYSPKTMRTAKWLTVSICKLNGIDRGRCLSSQWLEVGLVSWMLFSPTTSLRCIATPDGI